jgi:CheY-like chemotaxis protein
MSCGGFYSVDSLRGVWIVVVDADPRGRGALVDILTYCGALVTPVASGREALDVMRQVKPDVLVITCAEDLAADFLPRVRSLKPEEGGVVAAIAIGRSLEGDAARARGFQAHLRTPLDPWELCRTVSNLMSVP